MYVYRKTEVALWTVGFYAPGDKWVSESDYDSQELAAKQVHYLNGGDPPITLEKASIIIAQGLAANQKLDWGKNPFKEISKQAVELAKAVIEECNK